MAMETNCSVLFSPAEIDLATRLDRLGLPWTPRVGLYVWDAQCRIRPSSPFQPGVYFFWEVDCFVDYFGSTEALCRSVIWLPTWEQCRQCLAQLGVTSQQVARRLYQQRDFARLPLYEWLLECYQHPE